MLRCALSVCVLRWPRDYCLGLHNSTCMQCVCDTLMQAAVAGLVAARKLEFVGGGWVQHDMACPDDAAVINQARACMHCVADHRLT